MAQPADTPAPLQIGQRLGNYRIVRPLGQGGMGAVFEAVHQYIERQAAVKVLHPDLSQNPQFASRFLNETRGPKPRRQARFFRRRESWGNAPGRSGYGRANQAATATKAAL